MTVLLLRSLHLQFWVVFVVVYGLYFLMASYTIINGYVREVTGWRHPGRPSRMHKVLWHWHTGRHLGTQKTYGDERRLRNATGSLNRATPEGLIVFYHPWKKWHRVVRNNLIIWAWLTMICGMVIDPQATVQAVVVFLWVLMLVFLASGIIRLRKKAQQRGPKHKPALSYTLKAKAVFKADDNTIDGKPLLVEETKPQLDGVPHGTIANLIAGEINASTAEVTRLLSMTADRGELILPDSFSAKLKQREPVEEVIEAHTKGKVRFEWITTETPRKLSWVPIVVSTLPDKVRFRDYLDQIEALGPREFGVGVTADKNMFSVSHNGDNPWHCRFAGSGTGKSMGFLSKAAQVCHKDPTAEVYAVDTKQVSFAHLYDIPRVYIYDNPQSEMNKIWDVFYHIAQIMDDRYTAVREKRKKFDDFHDIWLFVDEGNDLGAQLKSYNKNVLEGATASPPIWGECIARIFRQGRQARIFGEWMFQDLTDRAMGGESLKMAFNVFGAAGFLPGQFTRTIGPPAPDLIEGPGKILMCSGNKRTWVQGFYDDEDWLHEYALSNRKGRNAA